VRQVVRNDPPERLLHVYGPTESTTFASWYRVRDVAEGAATVPIGHPISNTQLYVLDAHLEPVPVGASGELYLGGDGLAQGYLNQPALTAERFVPHPFADEPGSRLYRTGDLARYSSDGVVEFLGRIDHQVKLRGFRVEPAEIETVLEQHPAVRQAVVLPRDDLPGGRGLVAYLVANQEAISTRKALRGYLRERLPNYMVPAALVFLDALPLTPNGKVDRAALPAPDQLRPEPGEAFVAPRTRIEVKLAEIWAQVLGLERVGVHDSFFDLGGHSLLATQVMSRVRETFHMDLPLRCIFERPTIGGLAAFIERILSALGKSEVTGAKIAEDWEEMVL
jgi:acyl carrier protein